MAVLATALRFLALPKTFSSSFGFEGLATTTPCNRTPPSPVKNTQTGLGDAAAEPFCPDAKHKPRTGPEGEDETRHFPVIKGEGQGPNSLWPLRLDPFPPSAVVPIGLSPPCVLPLPPWPVFPSLLPLPFPWSVVPTEPPDFPSFMALCQVHTEEGNCPCRWGGGVQGGYPSSGRCTAVLVLPLGGGLHSAYLSGGFIGKEPQFLDAGTEPHEHRRAPQNKATRPASAGRTPTHPAGQTNTGRVRISAQPPHS